MLPILSSYLFGKWLYNKGKHVADDSQSTIDQRNNLNDTAKASNEFASQGEKNYGAMTAEAKASRDYLRKVASGGESIAGEQLRQGLAQNMSAQRSMAASAAPQNQAMAARTAAMNMGRLGAGMSGQAAMAGLEERRQAQQALADMILKQRDQDIRVGLGGRQNAVSGYGGVNPEKSTLEKYGNVISTGAGLASRL